MDPVQPRSDAARCSERLGYHFHCDGCGCCPGAGPGDPPEWWAVTSYHPPADRGPSLPHWFCPACLETFREIVQPSGNVRAEAEACRAGARGHFHCDACGGCGREIAGDELPPGWWLVQAKPLGGSDREGEPYRLCAACTAWVWALANEEESAESAERTSRPFKSMEEMFVAMIDEFHDSIENPDEEAHLSRLLLRTRTNPDYYLKRGRIRLNRGAFAGAVSDFTRALSLDPGSSLLLRERAVAHQSAGRTEDALRDLAEAIRVNPTDAEAHAMRAQLISPTDMEAAAEHRRAALAADPGLPGRWFSQAMRLLGTRDRRSAAVEATGGIDRMIVDACSAVISIDDGHARAFALRALAYAWMGWHRASLCDASLAMEFGPSDPVVREFLTRAETER